ncbi:cytoglobin-1-like isoform X2 [Patiria miniata]|uniref:Globin domain-containing protein n=1 Tax=Patiria miniata TaxID=46514 RepID=A0A914ARH6_PATMI|nr:cytoglobin-1-like isoform X2 [Patiria miniata]XP_038065996.1 cytoglobin-1-like isoform X2 [Patiria miniata]
MTNQAGQKDESFFKQLWANFTNILPFSSDNDVPDEATGLTKEQKDQIKKSWDVVCTIKTKFGVELFAKFFERHPAAQQHFAQLKDMTDLEVLKKSSKMRAHGYRVVSAFCSLVENLDTPDIFIELLTNTGYSHSLRTVPHHFFEDLGPVFLDVMTEQLGDKFTPKAKEAWGLAYTFMCKVILGAMDECEGQGAK